ncbi:MAG: exodeoxyribonuclease VII small subunit [Polymorphobacter sp.]
MSDAPDPLADLSFEAALARLETIVHKLEAGDASLEESIAIYTEGQALKTICEAKLAGATARIEAIQLGTDGVPTGTAPFDA